VGSFANIKRTVLYLPAVTKPRLWEESSGLVSETSVDALNARSVMTLGVVGSRK